MTVFLYFICYSRLITFISYNVGFTPTYVFFDSSKIYIDIFSGFFKLCYGGVSLLRVVKLKWVIYVNFKPVTMVYYMYSKVFLSCYRSQKDLYRSQKDLYWECYRSQKDLYWECCLLCRFLIILYPKKASYLFLFWVLLMIWGVGGVRVCVWVFLVFFGVFLVGGGVVWGWIKFSGNAIGKVNAL